MSQALKICDLEGVPFSRSFFEVKDTTGRMVASATLEGQGMRVYLVDVFNNRPHWSFGPFYYSARLYITTSPTTDGMSPRWSAPLK